LLQGNEIVIRGEELLVPHLNNLIKCSSHIIGGITLSNELNKTVSENAYRIKRKRRNVNINNLLKIRGKCRPKIKIKLGELLPSVGHSMIFVTPYTMIKLQFLRNEWKNWNDFN